jgi:hypothetical protein
MIPNTIAIEQRATPVVAFPLSWEEAVFTAIKLIINPTPANGMLSQFKLPRHGKKATIKPARLSRPQTKDIVAIYNLIFVYL